MKAGFFHLGVQPMVFYYRPIPHESKPFERRVHGPLICSEEAYTKWSSLLIIVCPFRFLLPILCDDSWRVSLSFLNCTVAEKHRLFQLCFSEAIFSSSLTLVSLLISTLYILKDGNYNKTLKPVKFTQTLSPIQRRQQSRSMVK